MRHRFLISVLLIAAAGASGLYLATRGSRLVTIPGALNGTSTPPIGITPPSGTTTMTATSTPVGQWPVYTSEKYRFSLRYPPTWTNDEATADVIGKARAVMFSDSLGAEFFIFPEGGFGRGLPLDLEPKETTIKIGGVKARREDYDDDGALISIIRLEGYNRSNWSPDANRIEIFLPKKSRAEVETIITDMLKSFAFKP